ncbi:MAG: IS91 family transposase [Candidatus Aminicenantes bacterium]|nr:IS91 family transposase [Candidatus Aminicenantes bacterium]
MAGIYCQRHPERTVLYRVLFHYFERFLGEYEQRFEKEYGYFRPIIQDVVSKYLDCGNPKNGFARIKCKDCGLERLLMFSCHGRGFCPSCHAKRREEWGEWMREELLLDVPHRQVVFTVPKMLRIFFKYKRHLLSDLCLCGKEALLKYFKAVAGRELTPGIIVVIQSFGSRINLHPHLHFLVSEGGSDREGRFHSVSRFNDDLLREIFTREVFSLLLRKQLINLTLIQKILRWRHTGFHVHSKVRARSKKEAEQVGKYMIRPILSLKRLSFDEAQGQVIYQYGKHSSELERMDYLEFIARVTSHIPDKGQVMIRYYGLFANAHRGKKRKMGDDPSHPPIIEEEERFVPSKGWADMIRKVYEIDPLLCPQCGGQMRIISFIEEHKVIDKIINHLKLTFKAERPPPSQSVQQELLMAAEESGEYF